MSQSKITTDTQKVKVIEFFSYGCSWCYKLEPNIQKWLKTKPKDVEFIRVPVSFNQQWEIYAKAYYTADALGVAKDVTADLFDALQNKKSDLSSEKAMADFFVKHGVSKEDFENAFIYSPSMDLQVKGGTVTETKVPEQEATTITRKIERPGVEDLRIAKLKKVIAEAGKTGPFSIIIAQIDPDAIGSAFGFAELLKFLGQESNIYYAGRVSHPQNEALCNKYVMPILKKSQYRIQMTNPTPTVSGKYACSPIGATTLPPDAGRAFPVKGEDFGYLLWRKRNCCML